MVDPALVQFLDDYLNCENDESLEPPECLKNKKPSNKDLLTDVIEELDEYSRHRVLIKPPLSPDISDVSDLYLEDLIKIQEKLKENSDESSAELNKEVKIDFEVDSETVTTSNKNETTSYLDCMAEQQYPTSSNDEEMLARTIAELESKVSSEPIFVNSVSTMSNTEELKVTTGLVLANGKSVMNVETTEGQTFTDLHSVNLSPEDDIWNFVNKINASNSPLPADSTGTTSTTLNVGKKRTWSQMVEEAAEAWSSDKALPQISIKGPEDFEPLLMEADSTTSESDSNVSESTNPMTGFDGTDSPNSNTDGESKPIIKKEIRKKKNNEASRVHRAKKKRKYEELFDKKVELEKRNAELQIQAESMQKEAEFLRELLLVKVAASSKP
ncbi:uncharacterized protein [Clytia hemisphaerica]|uniref:BZIP domain-containing protein n=1 Tax=Clytia hemisphaerica TaxID=252671 RepID=A0A7M5WMC1_9CNID